MEKFSKIFLKKVNRAIPKHRKLIDMELNINAIENKTKKKLVKNFHPVFGETNPFS